MIKQSTSIILFLLFTISVFSQKGDAKKANELLSLGNFEAALDEYLLLGADAPDDIKYNYRIAVCYLNTNGDKSRATPYLEKITNSGAKFDNNTYYLLGRAYHYAHKFDDAIKMFIKYKELGSGTAATLEDVDKQIEYCQNAKELIKFPISISFETLGAEVNSPYPDYYPFVPVDESFIVFNSRRNDDGRELSSGQMAANVYISKVVNGKYQKATLLDEKINTVDGNEEVIGLSANGDIMLLLFDDGNIYMTNKTGNTFSAPVMLDEAINSKDQEIAASITRDGNAIYFASNRKGGYGGTDIYVSRKLPIGGWGPPQNLGEEINTPFDEDFPNISPDGLTLYFSSKGHTSMGGYDIFTSKYNATTNKFEIVRNIGYPLNTVNDDMNFRVSETGRYGYIAALKPNGLGDLDIYRVTFNEIEPSYTVIKGLVRSKDPNMTVDDILISVVDKKTGDDFGAYVPNRYTMRYIMILPPGKYTVMIDADGFTSITEDVEILDKSSFESEIDKDIILVPNK